MDFKENETDIKETQITNNLIKIPIYYKDEKYIIKIYPSIYNINIIFKLEKDKVLTYYFFEKYDLKDFKQKNKIFLKDSNIKEIFVRLINISKTYFINLEIKGINMKILFKDFDTNNTFKINLKKKIVSQTKLNPLLEEQIEDNSSKLNIFRKQIIKLDRTSKIKNDLINSINLRIANINNTLNNISIINTNIANAATNLSSTKNSSSNEENSENNSNNNNEDEYQESMNSTDIGHLYPNSNQNQKQDSSNNNKKEEKNDKNDKTSGNNNKNNRDKTNNNFDTFFCFEKNDPAQNKKIIEFLIILNIITIIIVFYMLSSIYTIRTGYDSDDNLYDYDNDDITNSRLAYLSYLNNKRKENEQNFRDLFQEDLQNKEDRITSSSTKKDFTEKKKKKAPERYIYYASDFY